MMNINNLLWWVMTAVFGIILGLFYFGGLWWTLRTLPQKRRPKTWLAASFVVRTLVTLFGFWAILRHDMFAFFLSFIVFFITRLVLTSKLGAQKRGEGYANQS